MIRYEHTYKVQKLLQKMGYKSKRKNIMKSEKVLEIILREITAYGEGWRADWSEFDGRILRDQLNDIAHWAEKALTKKIDIEYNEGTKFYKEQTN